MYRPKDADVVCPRFHAKRVELTMVVVRRSVAPVDGHVEFVRAFDEIESVDRERDLRIAVDVFRHHVLDVCICTEAADAVRIEDADAEDEIRSRPRRSYT